MKGESGPKRSLMGDLRGDAYDQYFERLAATGRDMHGEATFIERLRPRSVLDAGCGTGRVARELARRGIKVVGVDIDADMIATARSKSPDLEWQLADLASVDLNRSFDAIVMAGNVMIFLVPGTEGAVLANMARHLARKGVLVTGFQMGFSLTLGRYDALADAAGLRLQERWATWDRKPWSAEDDYAVSVHRLNADDAELWEQAATDSEDRAEAERLEGEFDEDDRRAWSP